MTDYSETFGKWVSDPETLEGFRPETGCICGEDRDDHFFSNGHRFQPYWFCTNCRRRYLIGEDGIITPQEMLETREDGLLKVSPFEQTQLELLMEMEPEVHDYIDFHPLSKSGRDLYNSFIYAEDGLFVGYVVYGPSSLRAVMIAPGFRRNNRGTEMVESWFETSSVDEPVNVMAYEDRKPFFRQLSFKVNFD
ncbi:MAG: hypothetical protein ABEJ83_01085 [Candidatus Nanohaloarchaea archaeon]